MKFVEQTMKNNKSFLGRGWGFPVSFNKESKSVNMVSDEDDIVQSLHLLLSTRPGERITNPNYGCKIQNMVFEPLDSVTKFMMKDAIEMAVLFYEPRITLEDIEFESSKQLDGLVKITLYYTIRKTNIRTNIVFPFYKLEGTDITKEVYQ